MDNSKRGQRVGRIKVNAEFDAVLLVLLDQNFDATVIYEADRGTNDRSADGSGLHGAKREGRTRGFQVRSDQPNALEATVTPNPPASERQSRLPAVCRFASLLPVFPSSGLPKLGTASHAAA